MGNSASGSGLSSEMYRLRSSDHDRPQAGGKKHPGNSEKRGIKTCIRAGLMIKYKFVIYYLSLLLTVLGGQRPKGGKKHEQV